MAENEADRKAREAREAERRRLDADTDRRMAALARSVLNRKRGKKK